MDTLALRSLVAARPLRHPDEEPLIGSKTVNGVQILIFGRILPRHVSQNRAAQVRHVLTQRQLAVNLDLVYYCVLRILIGHAGSSLLEFRGVVFGPPVMQVSLGVELPAFVVEPVSQLMADGRAGVAVIWRVIDFRIEQRRL